MVAAEEGQSLQRDHRKRRRTGRRALALQRGEVMQRGGGGGRTVTEAVRVGGARGCSGDAGRRSGGRWWRLGTARTVGVVEAERWADGRRPAEARDWAQWRGGRSTCGEGGAGGWWRHGWRRSRPEGEVEAAWGGGRGDVGRVRRQTPEEGGRRRRPGWSRASGVVGGVVLATSSRPDSDGSKGGKRVWGFISGFGK